MTPAHILRIALISTPLIAAMLVTPAFLIANFPTRMFPIGLGAAAVAVLICWLLNSMLYFKLKIASEHFIWRFVIGSAVMLLVSYIVSRFVQPPIAISPTQFTIMRTINVLAVNGIITFILELVAMRELKKRVEAEVASLKLANMEAQYKLLLEKTNPHFLFNALSTAKALIHANPLQAEDYLVRLTTFLRATFDRQRDVVSVSDELNLVIQYIELQRIRFGTSLLFEHELSTTCMQKGVPYFTLITLVENAIKHNAMSADEPLTIRISDLGTSLVVRNNRKEKFVMNAAPGTGLDNLRRRYELLSGKPPQIISDENHFEVRVDLLNL